MREIKDLERLFLQDVAPFINNTRTEELAKIWKQTLLQVFARSNFPITKATPQLINNWRAQCN